MKINVLALLLILLTASLGALPAFPEAEGYGAETAGGRGGKVIFVTNTNADGPGSFRSAITTPGPRTIVFKVSGVIDVGTLAIKIENENLSNVTVAGQTSPGGVTITGGGSEDGPLWQYQACQFHDAIWRFLRFRVQSQGANGGNHSFQHFNSYNYIIDHCDFSGGGDECLDMANTSNFTIQWSTITNSGPTGQVYGMLLAGSKINKLTLHHNFVAHHNKRGPEIHWYEAVAPNNGMIDLRNNVNYNFNIHMVTILNSPGPVHVNLVGNYYREGPSHEAYLYPPVSLANSTRFYESGCAFDRTRNSWDGGVPSDTIIDHRFGRDPVRVATPWVMSAIPVTTTPASVAYTQVLDRAGAWPRDPMNIRTVAEARNRTGALGKCDDAMITSGPDAPADSDNDGMPDFWETGMGFKPADSTDGVKDHDADGYTNLEEYLNDLALARTCQDYFNAVYPIPSNWPDYNPGCCDQRDTTAPSVPGAFTAAALSDKVVSLTWTASADAQSGVETYILYRDNTEIGRTATLAMQDTGLTENTRYSYTVKAVNGIGLVSAAAGPAVATTRADTSAPTVIRLTALNNGVMVLFSERVDSASAVALSAYSLGSGANVTAVVLSVDHKSITLSTSALVPDQEYVLTINNVRDASLARNIIATDTRMTFRLPNVLLVDFGATANACLFGLPGWDSVLVQGYSGFRSFGPGGTTILVGNNGSYNHQGVTGPAFTFKDGNRIVVTWYNNSSAPITFTPRISFTSGSATSGTWYNMTACTIQPRDTGTSVYLVTAASAGSRTLVNINCNYSNSATLICDKIELAGATIAVELSGAAMGPLHFSTLPNPFSGELCIGLHGTIKGGHTQIYDIRGRLAAAHVFKAGEHAWTWRPAGFPAGVYLVKVVAGNRIFSRKVLLQQ
ncbi:MAG: T9SS type A sorting domain-containing protein [Fibrobacteres bacterium]|nr:T9SS type A sorting domain-containing protein [Fibrobacterota bacterium]